MERDAEGYYVVSVPQLPGCHTQALSLDEVTQRIREAIELCLECRANRMTCSSSSASSASPSRHEQSPGASPVPSWCRLDSLRHVRS
ncbi:MAG: type II toxin-antitoxin system HicB family antitoxin [Bryobacteraceae bacterium]